MYMYIKYIYVYIYVYIYTFTFHMHILSRLTYRILSNINQYIYVYTWEKAYYSLRATDIDIEYEMIDSVSNSSSDRAEAWQFEALIFKAPVSNVSDSETAYPFNFSYTVRNLSIYICIFIFGNWLTVAGILGYRNTPCNILGDWKNEFITHRVFFCKKKLSGN